MKSQNILLLAGAIVVLYLITRKKSTTDTTSSGKPLPPDTSSTPTSNKVPTLSDYISAATDLSAFMASLFNVSSPRMDRVALEKRWNTLSDKEKILAVDYLKRFLALQKKQMADYKGKNPYDPTTAKKMEADQKAFDKYFADTYGEALTQATILKIK